jgi:hypothetical protein
MKKNVKTIYKFYKLVFDRGDINLECFNPETGTYASMACGRRFQSDIVRVKKLLLSLWSLTRKNNQTQEEMNVS